MSESIHAVSAPRNGLWKLATVSRALDPSIVPQGEIVSFDKEMDNGAQVMPIYPNEGNQNFGRAAGYTNQISFTVGSDSALFIPLESYIEWDVTQSAGTTGSIINDTSVFVERQTFQTAGGRTWTEDLHSNEIQSVVNLATRSRENLNSNWHELKDYVGVADSSALSITGATQHCILRLNSSLFSQVPQFPTPIIGSHRLTLYLAQDYDVFNLCGSGSTYKITNPRLIAKFQPVSHNYLLKLDQYAKSGGLCFNYSNYSYTNYPVANAGQNTVSIESKMMSCRKAIAVFRLTGDINQYNKVGIGKYQYLPGLVSLQYRMGSEVYPTTAIDSAERAYCEMLKGFGCWSDADFGNQITRTNYSANDTNTDVGTAGPRFITCVDFSKGSGLNSGLNTTSGNLQLMINYNGTATLTADIFTVHDVIVMMKSPGEFYQEF